MREDNRHRRRRGTGTGRASARGAGPAGEPHEESPARGERLQKILAAAGIASRRECEELILAGRVEVDRHVVSTLGSRADPLGQEIRVDGVSLPRPKRAYFLLNKPAGVVSTNDDPSGRTRVIDLIRSDLRLFPVGRLDRTSEGLIIVTNDGALANRLTHPRFGIEKTYLARCVGHLTQTDFDRLRNGVRLAEGVARVESIKLKKRHPRSSDLLIVLREGRNREIRRLLAGVGHKVMNLRRIAIGPIRIEDLPAGAHRKLLPEEVALLERTARDSKRQGWKKPAEAQGGSGRRSKTDASPSRRGKFQRAKPGKAPRRRKEPGERPRGPGQASPPPRHARKGPERRRMNRTTRELPE